MMPRRTIPLALSVAVVAAGCGPKVSLQIGVNERPVDVKVERASASPATAVDALPPVQPAPSPSPAGGVNAPGFVAAPVRVDGTRAVIDATGTQTGPACKQANGQLAPKVLAPASPPAPPTAGRYTFRRLGAIDVFGSSFPLAPTVVRTVEGVQQVSPAPGVRGQYRYRQVEQEPGITTTTTYRVDLPVLAPDGTVVARGGIFIEQILTESAFSTTAPDLAKQAAGVSGPSQREAFTPTPAVQIADLPFSDRPAVGAGLVDAPPRVSGGVDPVNGTAMNVRYRTIGHARIDACGDVFDAWEVEIHPDSQFVNAGIRKYNFDGRIAFATQLGGMVVSDQLHFAGDQLTIPYDLRTASTITSRKPEKLR